MTQPIITSSDDYREREPARENFENLPEPVQRRLFELMAAMTGALYLPEETQQQAQPQPKAATKATEPKPNFQVVTGGMSEQAYMLVQARKKTLDAFGEAA